jgi:hypothetical protein
MNTDRDLQARINTLLALQHVYKKDLLVKTTVEGNDLVIHVYEKGSEASAPAAAPPAADESPAAAQPAADESPAAAQPAADESSAAAQPTADETSAVAAGLPEVPDLSVEEELDILETLSNSPTNTPKTESPELLQLERDLQLGKPATPANANITLSVDNKKAISTTLSTEDRAIAEQMYLKYKQLLRRVHAIPPSERAKSNALTVDDVNAMLELYSRLEDVSSRPNNRIFPYVAIYDDLVRLLIKTCILYLFTTNAKSTILKSFKAVPGKKDLFTFTFLGSTSFELPLHTTLAQNQATLVRALRANIESVKSEGGRRHKTLRRGKRT